MLRAVVLGTRILCNIYSEFDSFFFFFKGVTSLFALIVVIMAALITDFTGTYYYGAYFTYAALAMATAILTLLTLPVMYAFFLLEFWLIY